MRATRHVVGTLLSGILGTAAASVVMPVPNLFIREATCRRDVETLSTFSDAMSGASAVVGLQWAIAGG